VLSDEACRRFNAYVWQTHLSNTNLSDDTGLVEFVAWAFVHEPEALAQPFAFQSEMVNRGLTNEKMRYIQTIVRAAPDMFTAFGHELHQVDVTS
jgi:hypothetical protein